MSKLIELPKSYEIRNIIDKYDLRWFSSDGYTYIFHHEVIQSQRLSPLSFKVKLRTYEVNDISLSDLLRPETIMVSGYQLECEIIYNEVNSKWGVNSGINDQELVPLVSVRKVNESLEAFVIQESYCSMEDKTDVDFRKSWLL